jgi:hypothetical protein
VYSSPLIITTRIIKLRRIRLVGHLARIGERRNTYIISVERPVRKRWLVRPRRRWVNGITTNLREIGWNDNGGIDLAQDRDQ